MPSSISTLLDLMRDPDTSPNTLDILESNLAYATSIAERLRAMPEVARVLTLQSFVPKDQDAKLAIIDDASFFLRNTLSPDQIDAEPTPAETVVAIEKTAHDLGNAAGDLDSPAAVQARRLAEPAGRVGESAAGGPGQSAARSGRASDYDSPPGERSSDRRTCEHGDSSALAAGALGLG